MDKKCKRNEPLKRVDNKAVGDLKKINEKIKKSSLSPHVAFPDRGDSKSPNQKHVKARLNIVIKKPTHGDSVKNPESNADKPATPPLKKINEKNLELKDSNNKEKDKELKEIELRKKIREKYTLKLKSIGHRNEPLIGKAAKKEDNKKKESDESKNENKNASPPADDPKKQVVEISTQTKEKTIVSSTSSTKTDNKQPEIKHRKPIIKTIMSKNGSVKIYKAVTFVDDKKSSLTHLEISIPGDTFRSLKPTTHTDTNSLKVKTKATVSRTSIKEKPPIRKKDRKREKRNRPVPSPTSLKGTASPPTEVAKWAPSCIDNLTKPYYEAWVNTTLAAISKNSKRDKLFFEKQQESLLKNFKKALERPYSPSDLFYENFQDEKYTGKIKITQR